MFCGNCGKELKQGIKFCPYCGYGVAAAREPVKQPEKPVKDTLVKRIQGNSKKSFLVVACCFTVIILFIFIAYMIDRSSNQNSNGSVYTIKPSGSSGSGGALIIKNWPYSGQGKIAIYIDEEKPAVQTGNTITKPRSELTEEEFFNVLLNALQSEPQSKRVASCTSLSLSPPFKLVSSEDNGSWTGNGVYSVKIFVPDDSVRSIGKTNVVFSNGSATIDYKTMEIKRKD